MSTFAGKFRLTRRLGAGGMGAVYLADQLVSRREDHGQVSIIMSVLIDVS